MEQVQVALGDGAAGQQRVADPVEQARPVGPADQHDREVADLAGLDQGQRLEQLVERAEATRQDDEAVGVLHEHHLAGEEVAELDPEVDVRVHALLVRQLDVAADGQAARLVTAAVGGLHRARSAAGDDRVARLGQAAADRAGQLVDRVVRRRSGPSRRR